MIVTDPIADMLTRIRNALMIRRESVLVPASRMKLALAKILKQEGFIIDYEIVRGVPHRTIKIQLRYMEDNKPAISGLKRVSKPGLRVYAQKKEITRVYGGLGISILSTSKGLRTGQQAWRQGTGGEILCYVW
ncbi:MAG: 30S ribosomal protein S8 [Chloroflexi bacterium RBG_13_57_8]|nr:MAG: 30S ribosomal protein S8 [Chloroflexi bacterium RBG_13_57_8]